MKTTIFRVVIGTALLLGSPVLADDDIMAAIDVAEAARKEAAAVGHEWRYTGKLIKEARAALEAGDLETAKKMAKQAHFEAKRALEQAEISKKNWVIAVPQ